MSHRVSERYAPTPLTAVMIHPRVSLSMPILQILMQGLLYTQRRKSTRSTWHQQSLNLYRNPEFYDRNNLGSMAEVIRMSMRPILVFVMLSFCSARTLKVRREQRHNDADSGTRPTRHGHFRRHPRAMHPQCQIVNSIALDSIGCDDNHHTTSGLPLNSAYI